MLNQLQSSWLAVVCLMMAIVAARPLRSQAQAERGTVVSVQRLEALDPAQPAAYKEYAEELAAKADNSEARGLALRLFHMAAWLDPDGLASGSLRSMIALARSSEEERRFRAAEFLLDPAADESALRKPGNGASTAAPPNELLEAIRHLRHGKREAARGLLGSAAVRQYVAGSSRRPLRDELQSLLAAVRLNDEQLRRALELELAWTRASAAASGAAEVNSGDAPWSDQRDNANLKPVHSVSLLRLTEFDPRECVFRSGRWSRIDQ